jgi:hypothetical protein
MSWIHHFAWFFGGAFLVNALPHLIGGMTGSAFQTPFIQTCARWRVGPMLNLVWGWFNFAVAYLLIDWVGTFDLRATDHAYTLAAGMLAAALWLARYGRRPQSDKAPEEA